MNDLFQAKATLQSVVDHCNEPDLVQQAAQRLANIKEGTTAGSDTLQTPGNQ